MAYGSPSPARLRLGEALLREGLITPEQLAKALDAKRAAGGRLGKHLLALGFVDRDSLNDVLARQLQIPMVDLGAPGALHPEAVRYCREDMALQWGFCPITWDEERRVLLIAVPEPDPQYLQDLEALLALKLEPHLATPAAIERATVQLYHPLNGAQAAPRSTPGARETTPRAPPASFPTVAAPPPTATPDPRIARQQLRLRQAQAAQAPAAAPIDADGISIDLGPPEEKPPPPSRPSAPAPPPVAPASTPGGAAREAGAAPAPSVEELTDRLARIEKTLETQTRMLRTLLEVLVDKGVVTKVEMAHKRLADR
jgi:hypothetical protein